MSLVEKTKIKSHLDMKIKKNLIAASNQLEI